MKHNSKHIRIFEMLQKAEDKGVSEADLFNDFESISNTSTIKNRLKDYIEKRNIEGLLEDKIIVKNGIWYLDKYFWNTTRGEVETWLRDFRLEQISIRNNYTAAGLVVVMLMFSVFMYNVGVPNTPGDCLDIFNTDEIIREQ